MAEFKLQIMPIMFWSLAYGATAGMLLFIVFLLSTYILIVWFPVFLVGVLWGAWRNYQQQKKRWYTQADMPPAQQSITQELRQAASDIASASRELFNQEAELKQDAQAADTSPPSDEGK